MKLRSAIIPLLLLSTAATAEVVWVPSVGFQMKTLDFDQELKGGVAPIEGELSIDIPTAQLGMTAIKDKFFASFKIDVGLTDSSTLSTVPYTNAYDDGTGFIGPASSSEVERDDMALTFGYSIRDNINVFVGYMEGKTTITPDVTIASDISGSAPNLAWRMDAGGFGAYEQEYSEDGFFVGASYAKPIEGKGTLAFSIAYADLDADYEDNYLQAGPGGSNLDFAVDGSATGISLAASWTGPITDRLSYYFDARQQSYDMDGKDSNGNFPGLEIETEETIIAFAAGLRFVL